jgi:antirestriction protein ArdC
MEGSLKNHDLYEKVTNQMIAELEKGAVPWVKPWNDGNGGGIMPINAAASTTSSF